MSEQDDKRRLMALLHALFTVCDKAPTKEMVAVYGKTLAPYAGDDLWKVLDGAIAQGGKLPTANELRTIVSDARWRRQKSEERELRFSDLERAAQQPMSDEARAAANEFFEQMKKL